MSFKKKLIVTMLGMACSSGAKAAPQINLDSIAWIDPYLPTINYVSYQTLDHATPLTESAQLRVPVSTTTGQQFPAVVILHGTAGIDSRGKFYAEALNEAGIATLEVDLYTSRGILGGGNAGNRPNDPAKAIPDAFGALKYLASLPNIDPNRIAVLGFSLGGVLSLLSATEAYNTTYANDLTVNGNVLKFAAHVANYPICYLYNRAPHFEFTSITGSPILIQEGSLDAYDTIPGLTVPQFCKNLKFALPPAQQSAVSVNIYNNDTHGWDRLQPALSVVDPFAHLHQGGQVQFTPNLPDAYLSRQRVVMFFENAFGL